jgi:formate dehydrogenase
MTTHHTFCRICESLCGLEVTIEGGQVTKVRPDEDHVATRGFACVKGVKQAKIFDSPDRVKTPLKRVGDRFEPVSWDEALADIGARVRKIRGDHHPDAIAMYVGTAAGFSTLHPIFAQGFMTGLGSGSMYATATQDCANKFAVARHVYGFPFLQPFPDLARTNCLIIVGANPIVSKWSFLQVPNPFQHLHELRSRGAKVWVVDPRRTETAKQATGHVFIRPDADVFFYLSFLHEVLRRDAIDHRKVDAHTTGLPELRALAAPWTPERTAPATGIDPDVLRQLVDDYVTADGAALYCSTGVNMGTRGALAFWLQEAIQTITGNLDRPGGTLVGEGIVDFPGFGKRHGVLMRDDKSRIGGFGAVNDAFPGGILADEILTPGDRQVRALFVTGGNPLITMPNAGRLKKALAELELLVTVDLFVNETGSLAHYVLPATSPLQRPDLPFIFPLFLGLQAKPYLQATRALLPKEGDQRDEATIYHDLARACGVGLFGSKVASATLEAARRWHRYRTGDDAIPQEALLSLLLRLSGEGSFDALTQHPHGRARPAHTPGSFLPDRVLTDDHRVHLAPPELLAAAQRLDDALAAELRTVGQLKLITKRALTTHNSWTHNLADFVEGDKGTNHVWMHPDDAQRLGLREDDVADVRSATATIRLPVKLLDDLMPGVVAVPHGWGHQHARGLSVASRTRGVNVNLLAADGPDGIDRVAGMAHLTGIPVDVFQAAGPLDPTSWSGIAPA